MSGFLTLKEVAERYRVTTMTVFRWRKAGRLPEPVKLGRRPLFKASDLLALESARA